MDLSSVQVRLCTAGFKCSVATDRQTASKVLVGKLTGRLCWATAEASHALQVFEERQAQVTMDSFLTFSQRFAKVKSARLQRALAGELVSIIR